MAKAKKTESKAASSSKKKQPAKKAQPSGPPLVDTNLAASSAAAMIANRGATANAPAAPRKESAGFRQLKEGLNKPASSVMGNLLDNAGGQKKSNLPFERGKQVGRNQTFGADVNRSGVPRRTAG